MQAAGARRLQRARRGQQVSSAHASPRAPPSHFRLRPIGTDPTDCLVLSGAPRTTPFHFFSAAGCRLGARRAARAGVVSWVEGTCLGARGPWVGWVVRAWPFLPRPAAVFITFYASLVQRFRLHASPARHCILLDNQRARVCQLSLCASCRVSAASCARAWPCESAVDGVRRASVRPSARVVDAMRYRTYRGKIRRCDSLRL